METIEYGKQVRNGVGLSDSFLSDIVGLVRERFPIRCMATQIEEVDFVYGPKEELSRLQTARVKLLRCQVSSLKIRDGFFMVKFTNDKVVEVQIMQVTRLMGGTGKFRFAGLTEFIYVEEHLFINQVNPAISSE